MAVQRVYKGAQCTIGPWIDRGFYYDFDTKEPIEEKDLKKIKKEMQKIVKAKLPFIREEVRAAGSSNTASMRHCLHSARLCHACIAPRAAFLRVA